MSAWGQVLAHLNVHTHPSGMALWRGVCVTLGLRGESPLGGATVVGSLLGRAVSGDHPRRGSFSTPAHWHAPAVCNLALSGTARKRYLLVPWSVARSYGMDEHSAGLLHAEDVLVRIGGRASECCTPQHVRTARMRMWPVQHMRTARMCSTCEQHGMRMARC
jgi:hypothetical protein